MSEIKSLKEVVETLIEREYENETGKLIDDEDFRLLAEFAGIKSPANTVQQRRDEIVERAKQDIIKLQERMMSVVDFVVNREKRTVVALLRDRYTGKVYARGIAKCHQDDCFNVHIGKAIALRRALGLEVPKEYLAAPQPTEVRVGDVVCGSYDDDSYYYNKYRRFTLTRKCGDMDAFRYAEDPLDWICRDQIGKVIDDSREEV